MKKIVGGLILLSGLSASWAQTQTFTPPALEQQLARVENYLFNDEYEKAALLAERLYPEHKTNRRLYGLLKSAYLGLKEFVKLEGLMAEQLALSPTNKELYLDQLEIHLRQGAPEKAEAAAKTYLTLAAKDTLSYLNLANRYLAAGYAEEAIKIYQSARKTLLQPALFASSLAETYRSLRRWREALEEYLNGLAAEPANGSILPRLTSLMGDLPADDPAIGPFLDQLLAKKPSPLHYRLKGEWELRQGHYDGALAAYEEADRRGERDGRLLLELARKISLTNPEKMTSLSASYERRYARSPELPQLYFLLARAQTRLGDFWAARATYEKILATTPLANDKVQANFELAGLMLDGLDRPESALVFIEKVGDLFPTVKGPASLLRAKALAALDRFEEARQLLSQISGQSPAWREETAFLTAEWDFYFLNFAEAERKYTALLDAFPRGERANDALRRLALLKNFGLSKESSLSLFALFLKNLAQFNEKEAAVRMAGLEGASPDLAAEANYSWGIYLSGKKRLPEAESAFTKIKTVYAKTPQAPLALEKLGELAEASRRPEAAKSQYETVLESYPDAVNAESVRGKLRRLRERTPEKPQKTEGKS
ncbi:MAG: tetratricopeptide repeat protein [candidate division Zixibacteria bacterium]|nr:tetratricopeptide repeat protein [candidate division Zixibacteria bacterium]